MTLQSNNFLAKSILQKEREIIFIDPTVEDYQSLIVGINPDTKVVILDRMKDGISQITENLQGGKYKAVHIVSHGSEGSLQLGSKQLNSGNLDIYKSQLQQWANYLTDDADILLYGCDVAGGKTGVGFVKQLSQLTGADVAASDDLTGNAALGGDWDLEVKTGKIESPLAFQVGAMEAYQYILPAEFTAGSYTQNFNGLASSGTPAWADDSTISGWYATRQNGGTFTTYTVSNGSSGTGTLYSFGSTSTDRALGSVGSGTPITIYYGVRLVNNTGSPINSLRVSYTGEQWRNGGGTVVSGTTVPPVTQKLAFDYQTGTNLTSLTTGTWTDVSSLDFTGPIGTNTASALDGNNATNKTAITSVINLATSLAVGQEIMLRWEDINDPGNDHGLAIDDFSVEVVATPSSTAPNVTLSNGIPSYTENIGSILIDTTATVNDSDSPNFNTGTLTIRFTSVATTDDRLSVRNEGTGANQINLDGRIIKYGSTQIGTFSGGIGTENLVINLNANATPTTVQALLQNITYANVSQNPSATDKTVEIVLTDGGGGTSSPVSKTIKVMGQNDAPLAGQTIVLYDGDTNKLPTESASAPNAPWFAYQDASILFGGSATQFVTGSGTKLTTDNKAYAGYINYGIDFSSFTKPKFTSTPLNSAFPILDRNSGYVLSFTAQLQSETTRTTGADKNQDSKDDRAGFSVIIISNDKKGIELGFWANRIWAQEDGTTQVNPSYEPDNPLPQNSFRTLFTQAEGATFTTTSLADYDLAIYGETYTLFANSNPILSGRLRDYTAFQPQTYSGVTPPDPYEQPNFIFLGDSTPQAGATVNLERVAVTTNSNLPNQTINEDQTAAIAFSISDFETAADSLSITPISSDTTLIPNSNLVISGTGANRTITVTPAANQNGTAKITLNVSDGINTTVRSFDLTVNSVNDAPTFTIGNNQSVKAGTGQQTINGWAYDFKAGANESNQSIQQYIVEFVNDSDKPLFNNVAPTIDYSTGNLKYTPTSTVSSSKTVQFRVKAQDSGGTLNGGVNTSDAQTFTITVNLTATNSINGTPDPDNLIGTDQNDRISGLDGNDTIYGGLGSDRIFGGNGNDSLYGDLETIPPYGKNFTMDDTIAGGNGSDRIYGNLGNDKLYGDEENDQIWGGEGNDEIWGGYGNDTLYGDVGKDTFVLVRGQGTDTIMDFKSEDVLGCAGALRYSSLMFKTTQDGDTLITDKGTSEVLATLKGFTGTPNNGGLF